MNKIFLILFLFQLNQIFSQEIFGTYELKYKKIIFSKIIISKDSTCNLYSYQKNLENKESVNIEKGILLKKNDSLFFYSNDEKLVRFQLIFKKNKLITITDFHPCKIGKSKKYKHIYFRKQ